MAVKATTKELKRILFIISSLEEYTDIVNLFIVKFKYFFQKTLTEGTTLFGYEKHPPGWGRCFLFICVLNK